MFDVPEPKKIAPDLTPEQRQALSPVDLLVQYVMPKLLDKQNALEWRVRKELHELCERVRVLEETVAQASAKKSRSKVKKAEAAEAASPPPIGTGVKTNAPIQLTRIADYDPDADKWFPKKVGDVEITASVIDLVALQSGSLPMAVSSFIYDLSDKEREALCQMFPDDTDE